MPNAQVCVCIWRYILQNYNYKLHFQNLSTYHIPHVSIGTLAAENIDVCTASDPWDSNIQLTMVKDRRLGPGMCFLDIDTCAERGVFISARVFFPVWCHPWMDDGMDGWMEKASWPLRPLLYVILLQSSFSSIFFPEQQCWKSYPELTPQGCCYAKLFWGIMWPRTHPCWL